MQQLKSWKCAHCTPGLESSPGSAPNSAKSHPWREKVMTQAQLLGSQVSGFWLPSCPAWQMQTFRIKIVHGKLYLSFSLFSLPSLLCSLFLSSSQKKMEFLKEIKIFKKVLSSCQLVHPGHSSQRFCTDAVIPNLLLKGCCKVLFPYKRPAKSV